MNKKVLDILGGVAGLILAVAMYSAALSFPDRAPDAARYVKFLAVTIMVLCGALIVQAWFRRGIQIPIQWVKAPRAFTITVVLTLAYAVSMNWVGFYAGSFFYMVVLAWALKYRQPVRLMAFSLCLLLAVYGVFEKFLGVPVPHGVWEAWL